MLMMFAALLSLGLVSTLVFDPFDDGSNKDDVSDPEQEELIEEADAFEEYNTPEPETILNSDPLIPDQPEGFEVPDFFNFYLEEHSETLFGSLQDDQILVTDESGAGRDASYLLGAGDDLIVGTSGSEFFAGMEGDDTIFSGS
ncbi:MAG: hypothetical protein AB8B82_09725 [Roseovarius sp.]